MPHTHIEKVPAMQIFYIYDLYQSLEMETRFVEDNVNAKVKSKSRDSPIKKSCKLQLQTQTNFLQMKLVQVWTLNHFIYVFLSSS